MHCFKSLISAEFVMMCIGKFPRVHYLLTISLKSESIRKKRKRKGKLLIKMKIQIGIAIS